MTEADFLAAVCATPDDLGPRLAFADWLTDRDGPGDADRSELIRLQCRIDGLKDYHPDAAALRRRIRALEDAHRDAWLRPLPAWAKPRPNFCAFRRGFVEKVLTTAATFRKKGEALFRVTPLRAAQLGNARRFVRDLAASGLLGRLAELDFRSADLNGAAVGELAAAEGLAAIRRLDLSQNRVGDDGAHALAGCPHLHALTALSLDSTSMRAEDVRVLAESPHLGALDELSLLTGPLRGEEVRPLAGAPLWGRLRRFHLSGCDLGPGGLRSLLEAPAPRLVGLSLSFCRLREEGVAALAASPLLAGLEELGLDGNDVGPAGARALARSPHVAGLRALSLHVHRLGDEGLQELAASPHLRRLQSLDLASWPGAPDPFGSAGVAALAASPVAATLTRLNLQGNWGVEDDAARALADSPLLAGLTSLNLSHTAVGPAGLEALLRSPHLGRLAELHRSSLRHILNDSPLDRRLRERFGPPP
jgi:uncharacterized protein (TIGR02996 family)